MDKANNSKVDAILIGITILVMGFFSIPKLLALKPSVEGFSQFGDAIPMDNMAFMYFTGAFELLTALVLLSSFFVKKYGFHLKVLGFLMVFSTMIGGLLVEFFARPKPEMPLVIIAIALVAITGYEFYKMRNKIANLA